VTPAGKRKQRSTKRVFEARPPFFGGSSSVNLLLRNANQTSCIARTIKTLSAFLHAVEGPQAQLAQGGANDRAICDRHPDSIVASVHGQGRLRRRFMTSDR
jgi:hypothetical protein